MPFGDVITGMSSSSATAVSSGPASASVTPWLTKNAGRSAFAMRSTTRRRSSGEAPGFGNPARRSDACSSTSSSSWKTLNGTSRFTGPGRPDSMRLKLWRSASGSMSTRVGWKVRFTYGRSATGNSAAWLR